MKYKHTLTRLFLATAVGLPTACYAQNKPAPPTTDATGEVKVAEPEVEPLTPEAEKVVAELRASLPADSEAIAMLDEILTGSTLDAEDGWFPLAKSQTRYGWDYVKQSYDENNDDKVVADEFPGSRDQFKAVDRTRDGVIDDTDFDWSEHSLARTPSLMMFFQTDGDANGKVTKEEFLELFARLDTDGRGYVSQDDMRQLFQRPPSNPQEKRPDEPSRSTLVLGLQSQEIGSLQPGPQLNEPAPDFTLTTLKGEPVTLSKEVGDKPIVLIFGNFTCGPFRSHSGNIEKLYARYQDQAKFFLVYVREAHPSDGWWMMSNQRVGISRAQPKNNDERREVAQSCQSHLN